MVQKMQFGYLTSPTKKKGGSGSGDPLPSLETLIGGTTTPSLLGFFKKFIQPKGSKYQSIIQAAKRHLITRIAKEEKKRRF